MHSENKHDSLAPRFDGRFSDGATAGSTQVEVRLSQRGVLIYKPGTTEPVVWPHKALSLAEPLRKNSIDALVTCSHQDGATLFVPGGVFARTLGEFAPHLTVGSERWRNTRPWILAAAALAAVVALIYVADLTPARYLASYIPNKVRVSLGKQSIDSLIGERGVCVAKHGSDALDRLVKRLSAASGSDTKINVRVADWGLVNAFTTPGAQIVVTRGLITKARTPDELAGVIAHEIGHGISLHPETAVVRAVGLTAIIELVSGGGGSSVANLGLVLAQLSYTRSAEREADDEALRILKQAKVSPNGLAAFFQRVSKMEAHSDKDDDGKVNTSADTNAKKSETASGDNGSSWTTRGFDMLRTHPSPDDRLAHVRQQPDYPATPALNQKDWTDLRAICSKTEGGKPKKVQSSSTQKSGTKSDNSNTTPGKLPTSDKSDKPPAKSQ